MNNQDLQKIAEKVINKVNIQSKDKEKFGSVIIILSVISILLTLIRVMQECNRSKIGRAHV